MKDGLVRRVLKRAALWNFELNLALTRRLRARTSPPPYVLGGGCHRCARCCESPAIQVSRAVWHLATLRAPFLWWQRHVNGFVLVERDPAQHTFVFECTHFERAERRCDSYASRPGMCRDYPRALLDQPGPEMLPGCGYVPVLRNAAALRAALRRAAITDDQRARLVSGLRLDGPAEPR